MNWIEIPVIDDGVDEEVAVRLQQGLNQLNSREMPTMDLPSFSGNVRHGCTKARLSAGRPGGVSTALAVRERYVEGWAYSEDGRLLGEGSGDGVHAILFKEGRCTKCGYLARSHQGRVVRIADRPPMFGRVARG